MRLRHIILEKLAELGEGMLDAFFPAHYPEARLWRELLGAKRSYRFSRPVFSSILSQLRKDGFVERRGAKSKAIWRTTTKGRRLLSTIASQPKRPAIDGIMRIVSFDIPERERKKRRWVREILLECGYRPLQKSVWIGYAPLPEDFFEDADLLSLRECIHIFSINQPGTIRQVDK